MSNKEQKEELEAKVSKGLKLAYKKLVKFKKEKNSPLIVMEDGKIIAIPPGEIPPTIEVKK